jgi:dihydrofolate reductase
MSNEARLASARPRCSVYIAVSLDGYIARADGGLDWLAVVERPGEDYGYKAFFDSVDVLVIGRKTYETALGFEHWPYEGKRCIVVTRSSRTARHGETFHAGALTSLLDRLEAEGAQRVYVDGGALIRSFLAEDLVDDMTLSVIPVLLGAGISLFGAVERRLSLVASRSFPSGLVQLSYNVERSRGA